MPYVVNSPLTLQRHSYIESDFLECAVSVSWSQSRGQGCAVFFCISFLTCAADLRYV